MSDYVKTFDAELTAKSTKIAEAEKEIDRLTREIRKYESSISTGSTINLRPGPEQFFYANEFLDIILETLEAAISSSQDGSRREHVLKSIANSNKTSGTLNICREKMKKLFRGYTKMDLKTRDELEKMGFSISEDGKHYKLVFQNDGRYTFSVSKTASDHRTGLNMSSDISKILF